ncbi:alpha-L-rhamnosidase N-terminal domain-containing protein [Streptomyces sp. NPDC086077]|uniref:alpha-L-rhamnosidase N-terminal domain-containing protein n=1 Tax=Streptomyces sp. NPDC086077 TaxID=3154862 RepID=UPI00341CFB78
MLLRDATLGPTTSSNWYGGEDYDARREVPGWDEPGRDRSSWAPAVAPGRPGGGEEPAALSARETEPVRVMETLKGTEVPGADGSRVFDLGRNIAG